MFRELYSMLKAAIADWSDDESPRLGAALAYYTLFSLAPLLVIIIGIASWVLGSEEAKRSVITEVSNLAGPQVGETVRDIVEHANKQRAGLIGAAVGFVTLLIGASGAFVELQTALNRIWEAPDPPKQGWLATVKQRGFAFLLVLAAGFLLLLSVALTTALAAAGKFVEPILPAPEFLLHALNVVVSVAVLTLVFALIYRYIPDVEIAWGDVWLGAAFTAALFTVGKTLISMYLGMSGMTSAFGAAGSVIALLVWIYYSTLIFFFGAEFTQVYACEKGSKSLSCGKAPTEQPA
ncbi:MAG: YihY/virulence factor BrkB family protein [Bryobacteraceae bacterium]|nr:YihY/virulence factor BrkB family protein [Bryobacteraceae bacterium]